LGLRSFDATRLVLRLVMVYLWDLIGCPVLGLVLRNTIVLSVSSHNNVGEHNNLAASV